MFFAEGCRSLQLLPPRRWSALHDSVLIEILEERVELRRHRRNHRGVKRKMSNFPLADRSKDRNLPAVEIRVIASGNRKL